MMNMQLGKDDLSIQKTSSSHLWVFLFVFKRVSFDMSMFCDDFNLSLGASIWHLNLLRVLFFVPVTVDVSFLLRVSFQNGTLETIVLYEVNNLTG